MNIQNMTRRKNRALQVPPVVPYKNLEKFPKALYGTTPVMYILTSRYSQIPLTQKS